MSLPRIIFLSFVFSISLVCDIFAQSGSNLESLLFTGTYRKTSKTSLVKMKIGKVAPYVHFFSLNSLMATFPKDDSMRQAYPKISDVEPELMRTPEELRNVEVDGYIYAVKLEGDNDLHVILGTTSNPSTAQYMNTEISGLPENVGLDFDSLKAGRHQFLSLFPNEHFSTSSFTKLTIQKVRVRGATIFDADHHPGCKSCPGPSYAKPQTVWEIHPVVWMEFEPTLTPLRTDTTSGSTHGSTHNPHQKHKKKSH